MRNLVIICFLLITGCATKQYGNYTDKNNTHEFIVDDALLQISDNYPPAKTVFSFIHEINKKDAFGLLLVNKMRSSGYAIQEYTKGEKIEGDRFAYTLDKLDDLYWLTIYVDDRRLSRPYLDESGYVTPGGSWSRKE